MRMWDFFCTFAAVFWLNMHFCIEKYMYMKRYFILLAAAIVCSTSVWAVMATPEPIVKTQADGSTVTLKLVGDEFHSYYTSMDGTPLRLNERGMWVEDASVAIMPEKARRARRMAQQQQFAATFPLTGSPHSVVILVNFSDSKFRYKQEDFDKMLNVSGYSDNGGVGSARDYFIASSDSIFSPIFDCYGPVTLAHNSAYYDAHTSAMIVEACMKVSDELGVNMAQYDTNNDGRLDNVFVYYAGHNEAEGGPSTTIWPHRSIVQTGDRVNGKLIYDYACTSELRGSAGTSMCGIGTFCHEFGHVLGLPDYYDTQSSATYTIGSWDIMCSGSYNGNGKTPPTYTAGERFELGWVIPVQLTDAGQYTLEPIENGKKQIYLIANETHNLSWGSASPSEYWLLENRQNVGWDRHSTSLPGTGLLIWHVDYSASAWGSNTPNNSIPLRYDIEEAGGVRGYASSYDPYPGAKNVTSFTPMLHNGTIVEQPLTDITEVNKNIIFTFKSNGFMFLPAEMPVIQSTYNKDTKISETPAQKVRVVGSGLDPEIAATISVSGSGFNISLDSLSWSTSLSANVKADSVLETDVYVRYAPRKQVCDIQRGSLSVRHDKSVGTLAVRGTSPRPTLIGAPVIDSIENLTPTTFRIHWTPQEDAEEYYVTLYHMEDGRESTVESFENFDEEAGVAETGWYTSFYRTTTKAKESGAVSLWFKENNERIISPIYTMPVVELSMWLNAPATTDNEVGFFTLIGYSDAGIDTLDVIQVTKNTKRYTYTRNFTEEEGYRRFEMVYTSVGGEGTCLDAFTTTFNHKTIYTYKGRERTIVPQDLEDQERYTVFNAYDLKPNTSYYVSLQCSESKGCEEHLSSLSMPLVIFTPEGEAADSKHLTLVYDSIHYDPARHVIYLPQSITDGFVNIYSTEGELVKSIPVSATYNIVPLDDADFQHGAIYIVKYLPNGSMGRKTPWIKIRFI